MQAIHWFRQDLRLVDNPALNAAAKSGTVWPVYILENAGEYAMGAASRWWLHHSLNSLQASLGGQLSFYCGNPADILLTIASRHNIAQVFWNRCYEPWRITRDETLKKQLQAHGIEAKSFNGSLLWEPWQIQKPGGGPYKVFTPFYRKGCLGAEPPRRLLGAPQNVRYCSEASTNLAGLQLLSKLRWKEKLDAHWHGEIGEAGAQARLSRFIQSGLAYYKDGRDLPAKPYVSRLSPALHFGELSPNQLWHSACSSGLTERDIDHFCSELGWREFSYSQLYYHPALPRENMQQKFDHFAWADPKSDGGAALNAWKMGQTGIPMVDAGMRELWQTGYMHNRLRMIVGSFLVKNLRFHWHHGERWFWDTLVDADLASNSASWQWVAGCGADAAPYFRIFNPVLQGQKFDPEGEYIRRFVGEIVALPNKYLFAPWAAPPKVLKAANIQLGEDYPAPIIDLQASRKAALAAFDALPNVTNT